MATVNNILTRLNNRGVYIFKYGYQEVPSSLLMFYDLSQLNNPNFDFKTAKPKNVVREVSMFADEKHKVKWYEEDVKELNFEATADAAAGTTNLTLSIDYLKEGDAIVNTATGETMIVLSAAGTNVTVDANNNGVTAGDTFRRVTYAKTYGVEDSSLYHRNDAAELYNYVQYDIVDLNSDETDLATLNLTRLFYNNAAEYLKQEVFARASRKLVLDMMQTLYTGKRALVTVASGNKYYTGGLDYMLNTYYPQGYNVNVQGATEKETIQNIRDEVTKSYASGVPGLWANNRLVMFVNTAMGAAIDDLFMDKIVYLESGLEAFGINMKEISMNGRKITMVEDSMLNYLYPDTKVGYIVDLQGIGLFQVENDVVAENGQSVPRMAGVAKIFVKPQITPEVRQVQLFAHWGWVFKNVTAGVYRKLVMA